MHYRAAFQPSHNKIIVESNDLRVTRTTRFFIPMLRSFVRITVGRSFLASAAFRNWNEQFSKEATQISTFHLDVRLWNFSGNM